MIIGAAIMVIAIAVIAIGLFIHAEAERTNAELTSLAHKTYTVDLSVSADGWDPATSSPIPMLIEGADFEGNPFSQAFLYDGSGHAPFELMRGNYTVSIPSSPFAASGGLFEVDGAATTIVVDDPDAVAELKERGYGGVIGGNQTDGDPTGANQIDGDPIRGNQADGNQADGGQADGNLAGEGQADGDPTGGDQVDGDQADAGKTAGDEPAALERGEISRPLVITPIAPIDATPEMIQAAYQALIDLGYDAQKAKSYKQSADNAHNSAAERVSKKADFQARLNNLATRMPSTSQLGKGNIAITDIAEAGAVVMGESDALVNEAYEYVLSITPEADRPALQASQSAWKSAADASNAEAERKLDNNPTAGAYINMQQKPYIQTRLDRTQELINMI